MMRKQKGAKREFSGGGIIVKRSGQDFKVLLIKDGYGHWTWPKGHIEKNENSSMAAVREIEEEVGFKNITFIDEIDKIRYFYRRKGDLIFKTVYIYLFEAAGNEKLKVLKSEIEDAKWFSAQQALSRIEYKGAKEILQKAIERFRKIC